MKLYGFPGGGTPGGDTAYPAAAPAASGGAPSAPAQEPVVITGAGLGLPGVTPVFDDTNIERILAGQQFITSLPQTLLTKMSRMRVTRLVKDATTGSGSFQVIDNEADVVKLAGQRAPLDVVAQYGIDAGRDAALDTTTRLALGAGFDALRDAGIPLVMHYKKTTIGSQLPDRWGLPDAMRDDTGIIFASAFPGYHNLIEQVTHYTEDRARREHLLALEGVRTQLTGSEPVCAEIDALIAQLKREIDENPFDFCLLYTSRCV